MADYVTREMAREYLRKACRSGSIVSVLLLFIGLFYGAVAGVIAAKVTLPAFVNNILLVLVPAMVDPTLALAECACRALLLLLAALMGILMFKKVGRTGEAFRAGQLRQLKFMALLMILLGFLPTVAGNCLKIAMRVRDGGSFITNMSFAVEPMCIIMGIVMFVAAGMLVAGANLGVQEDGMVGVDPVTTSPAPDYADVPDIASMPTAAPLVDVPDPADKTVKRP